MFFCTQLCTGVSIPRGYSRTEKDAALDALALAMLLVRDKRPQLEVILTQCDQEKKKNGTSDGDGEDRNVDTISDAAKERSEKCSAKNGMNGKNGKSKKNDTVPVAAVENNQNALLLQLVDQLATLAAAAEHNQKLYHQTESEPVHINWKELSRRMVGSGKKTNRSISTSSSVDFRRTDSLADVEMATMSELHTVPK